MSVVIVITIVLVVVFLAIVLTGYLLPVDHIATRTLTLNQTPANVWQVITDIQGMSSWHAEVTSVRRLPDQNGHEVWAESYGRNMIIPLETIEKDSPRRLVRRIATDQLAFSGVWEYVITPTTNGGCQLTVTERGSVHNPIFRFISRFVMGHATTIENYEKALAARFGETANIR
ncbi:MAG: SRPBCC family protein [Acidobacteriota bacterium]|nr:MAG: SRPBCC family protein [Acidobacteriota bacterium]